MFPQDVFSNDYYTVTLYSWGFLVTYMESGYLKSRKFIGYDLSEVCELLDSEVEESSDFEI